MYFAVKSVWFMVLPCCLSLTVAHSGAWHRSGTSLIWCGQALSGTGALSKCYLYMDVISKGALLRKCMSGWSEKGLFSRGGLTEYLDEVADEKMKVQTSILRRFSPLLSSPYTSPSGPSLFSWLYLSASSLVWNPLGVRLALLPPRVGWSAWHFRHSCQRETPVAR